MGLPVFFDMSDFFFLFEKTGPGGGGLVFGYVGLNEGLRGSRRGGRGA